MRTSMEIGAIEDIKEIIRNFGIRIVLETISETISEKIEEGTSSIDEYEIHKSMEYLLDYTNVN